GPHLHGRRHLGVADRVNAARAAPRVVDSEVVDAPLAIHGDHALNPAEEGAVDQLADGDRVVVYASLDRDGVVRRFDDEFVRLVAEVDEHRIDQAVGNADAVRAAAGQTGGADRLLALGEDVVRADEGDLQVVGDAG